MKTSLAELPAAPANVTACLPAEIFAQMRTREEAASRLLMAFVTSGLFFMLFPGTFLGVWNLLQISGRESVASISPAWLQAHGHAQVFGWVGSFILGIGLYSIPKLNGDGKTSFTAAWACWLMWTTGVGLRWWANVYLWHWRTVLPLSASLELVAFLIFFRAVSRHRVDGAAKHKLDRWIWIVVSASTGLLLVLLTNLAGCFYAAARLSTPAFPHLFDQRYLALMAWCFLVPFVWGFSAKWMPVFLGLHAPRMNFLLAAVCSNLVGLGLILAGHVPSGSFLFVAGAVFSVLGIRIFEASVNGPKIRGVHTSFPFFLRSAYAWLLVAGALSVAAVRWDMSGGIWGASRHALTVGFISVMILCVGQRVLPAFAGMRILWSTKAMFLALLLLTIGCGARVSSEVLAYQGYADWAWHILPLSALLELTALTLFAINMAATFLLQPTHSVKEPMVARIAGSSAE
jgi:hypothetical protein